jgi:hypothetical protein
MAGTTFAASFVFRSDPCRNTRNLSINVRTRHGAPTEVIDNEVTALELMQSFSICSVPDDDRFIMTG